jgi:alpha-ketoglutarate-dependent taurine dioxygenase
VERPSILAERVDGPKAWRSETIDDPSSWYYPLPERCRGVLERILAERGDATGPITEVRLAPAERDELAKGFAPVLDALESGRGFAIVEGMPEAGRTRESARLLYWLVGQCLGEPFEQNVQGTVLYDVTDTGQSVYQGARFSVTNAESSFHTDNSFGATVLDYVGLLCLNDAKSGGLSQNVSGYAALNVLVEEFPDVLEILQAPFRVDRRGGVLEGESPTVPVPVIERDGDELLFRYLRFWIEAGHEKAGEPLSKEQRRALDTLDEVLNRPALRVEFSLKPGQMYFINNRWILHNRTAFEDHAEPERRRHLVRLWLERRVRHESLG